METRELWDAAEHPHGVGRCSGARRAAAPNSAGIWAPVLPANRGGKAFSTSPTGLYSLLINGAEMS